ncbi:solute:sodium symporter family transporter [Membranihabitans maritimus]|uniref:solute:sodium symporter family transporter n=1 Tax=Membranihabitans maritimus TaxID=2904244 RepID=UPI001EFF7188|nr:solute:sodium symporter family transporter [Membranihabitans maritimus]
MDFAFLDILAFVGFLLFVIGVSLYVSRKKENTEDYFLAGRSLSWWVIGLSLIASNISTEHFVGMAGQGFRGDIGLAIASFEWIAAFALIVVAIWLLPRFLQSGIYTIPEYLEYRFDRRTRTLMSIFMLVFYVCITIATVLYAGAFALKEIFGMSLVKGVWLIGLTGGLYTVYGGLKAVVWSDVIQGTALLLGGALVTWLGMREIGGWNEFVSLSEGRLHTILPLDHPELPWLAVFVGGMWIPCLFYFGLNQFITQRTLGAKSIEEGQKGILFGACIKLVIPFIIVFPGIIAYELYGDQIANGDSAYPVLITNLLPAGLVGIMFAALFGATMSTLDSLLNSAATIFVIDIYKPFFSPEATPKKVVLVGRICTFILMIIACLWAPIISSFEGGLYLFLQLYWGFVQPGVVAVFFLGLVWWKVPPQAAFWGMLLNIPVYGLLLWLFPDIAFLHHMSLTLLTVLAFMVIYTYFKPLTTNEKVKGIPIKYEKDYKLSPVVKYWAIGVFVATVSLYVVFY